MTNPPRDVIQAIFSWLDYRSLFRCARVCKGWKDVFYSERVWLDRCEISSVDVIRMWGDEEWKKEFIIGCTFEYRVLGLFRALLEDPESLPGSLMGDTLPLLGYAYKFVRLHESLIMDDLARRYCPDYRKYGNWEDDRTWNACMRGYFGVLSCEFFADLIELPIYPLKGDIGYQVILYSADNKDTLSVVIRRIWTLMEDRFHVSPIVLHDSWIKLLGMEPTRKRKSTF